MKISSQRARGLATAIAVALIVVAGPALGWGHRGHAVIDRTAVESLPSDGPVFLRNYLSLIEDSSTLPDDWRDDATPFSKMEEDPNHGWFQEQFAFMHPIPRSRFEFIIALDKEQQRLAAKHDPAAVKTNVRWTGTLPYALVEVYGHLVTGFRSYRERQAHGESTANIETACAMYVAWMGHYVGDGAQPLHVTIHHNGWEGPDPKDYTRDPKIHGRMESGFVDGIGLSDKDLLPKVPAVNPLDGDVFDAVLAYLSKSGESVEKVYQLDKRGAWLDPKDTEARELIYQRTAAGAAMLRDLVYRAWKESALPRVPHVPGPTDSANPAYNPETGSAPADRSPKVG
ncbi:nuclease [Luteibacter aegosomaticola]|uniref:nuclease n=1 Tax=Luteibacter aegosomaticola TaxID=2911538 RepID=UPI001FF9B0A2|nr:nuclease [Luteibacter aegosomaticola]UPG89623.1 nuclease [Luteibacter aegosomaticola]